MKKLSLGLLSLVAAISLVGCGNSGEGEARSEEHTSELQSLS